jgi:TfoX/Sxy family transcriptional regulator of competence genes
MASDLEFVRYVCDQIEGAGEIRYRAMFGEYAVYCGDKVVALVCDDRLFVKPTDAGRAFIGDVVEAPAYPGAKPSFLIEDRLDDKAWVTELVRLTWAELPPPKPKKARVKRPR